MVNPYNQQNGNRYNQQHHDKVLEEDPSQAPPVAPASIDQKIRFLFQISTPFFVPARLRSPAVPSVTSEDTPVNSPGGSNAPCIPWGYILYVL